MGSRELTAAERADIKALVIKMCANYDGTYKECLLTDCACFMFGKWWTGGYCKYFQNAVLPLDPALMGALTGGEPIVEKMRSCVVCGKPFPTSKSQTYCSAACRRAGNRRKSRARMQKKRDRCYDFNL